MKPPDPDILSSCCLIMNIVTISGFSANTTYIVIGDWEAWADTYKLVQFVAYIPLIVVILTK